MQFNIVRNDDQVAVTVFVEGQAPLVAATGHPNIDAILDAALKGDESVVDLFDLSKTVTQKFEKLSERVSVQNGHLYFDGDEVDNTLANQVIRFMREGVEDYKPLVKFFENVQQNPNDHSRTQLYDWLNARDFTITDEGHIVAYKGVHSTDGENFESLHSGRALVNDEVKTGRIPQKVGDVVTMPRSEVAHDPATACHAGLHVGTFEYASDYNNGAMLEVHVNPRDVVSVPTDAIGEKVRVCRYKVVGTLDAPYTAAIVFSDDFDGWGDGEFENDGDDYCLECDRFECACDEDFDSREDMFENQHLAQDNSPFMEVFAGTENPDWVGESPVADLDDEPKTTTDVKVGDTFETTDKRRKGTRFTVESIEGDVAVGKSFNKKKPKTQVTRKVKLDRLTSYRYRRV